MKKIRLWLFLLKVSLFPPKKFKMENPLTPVEDAANKLPELINAQINAAEQKARTHKLILWLVIIVLVIAAGIAIYLMHKEQKALHARIDKDELVIKSMNDSVKLRDIRIVQIGKDMKAQDVVIASAQDSIKKAYNIINGLKISKGNETIQHAKDGAAIDSLNLNGKIRFITGGKR